MNNTLHKLANTCLGIQRPRVITSTNYDGLTIISATSGQGKNTLLAGIMQGLPKEDNLLILTESMPEYQQGLVSNASCMFQDYRTFVLRDMLHYLNHTDQKNIFIESYEGSLKSDQEKLVDLLALKEYCKSHDKNIYMCVYLRKEKL